MLIHYANLCVFHTSANEVNARVRGSCSTFPCTEFEIWALLECCFHVSPYTGVEVGERPTPPACSVSVNNCGNLRQICIADPHKVRLPYRVRNIQSMLHLFFAKSLKKNYIPYLFWGYQILPMLQYHTISYLSSESLTCIDVPSTVKY